MNLSRTMLAPIAAVMFAVVLGVCATALSTTAAFADTGEEVTYDKADFYSGDTFEEMISAYSETRATTLTPVPLSDEMKYFAQFESSCNYDKGLSSGDGYNAMGYYQFDRRYGLQNFLIACYNYDPETFSMFEQYTDKSVINLATAKMRQLVEGSTSKYEFTDVANELNAAWHAAYAADPDTFAALQDAWAYDCYYLPAEEYLTSIGIDITNRADCVKGLCWGMCNLFGSTGWKKFVGGVSDGYDWDGVYHELSEGVNWPGCGLTNSMNDITFVTTLCNYVVDNVAVFYKGQPQYHEGWQNRYKKELAICLQYLEKSTIVNPNDWYVVSGAYDFVIKNGILGKDTTFEPYAPISRGLLISALWRCAGAPQLLGESGFIDADSSAYYYQAILWAEAQGIAVGDGATSKFRPDDIASRQEIASFLYRYAGTKLESISVDTSILDGYSDGSSVSSWARTPFAWCIEACLLNEEIDADTQVALLAPAGELTQAELASALMTFFHGVLMYPTDVKVSEWYVTRGYLDYVLRTGLMIGDDKGMFNPYASVTRAQLVSILYRYDLAQETVDDDSSDTASGELGDFTIEGEESGSSIQFTDVASGSWYASAVVWASSEGIVSGYLDETFRPNKVIARQELARIIALYAGRHYGLYDEEGNIAIPPSSEDALAGILGSEEVPDWALDAMSWCAENDIITGVGVGEEVYLMPKETANRASLTRIIASLASLLEQ